MIINCPECLIKFDCSAGAFNRAQKLGYIPACSRACRKVQRVKRNPRNIPLKGTDAYKAYKADYDRQRRSQKSAAIRQAKAKAYYENHEANLKAMAAKRAAIKADPAKYAEYRAKHNAHCQTPEYKAYKSRYDKYYRASKYTDDQDMQIALVLLWELEAEIINVLPTHTEREAVRFEQGRRNKAQTRKRRAHVN